MLTLFLACSCHQQPEVAVVEPAVAPEPAPAPEPVDELTAVHRALSGRDAAPPCAEVEALSADPVATLTTIVETITMPPQAPMRAATCLVDGHAEAAADTLVGWMGAEETKGLALLVIQRFEDLPLDVAVRAAEAGLGGPVDAEVTAALRDSERPELTALLP